MRLSELLYAVSCTAFGVQWYAHAYEHFVTGLIFAYFS